jgi:predicted CXXCH cytochrome family protein
MARRTNAPHSHGAGALGAVATLVGSFAVAFLAMVFFSTSANAATAGFSQTGPRYALLPAIAVLPNNALPSVAVPRAALAAVVAGVHGPYTTVADECATCHRVHAGKGKNVLKTASPQSNLCFTCHDGTGANANVQAQYTDPTVPQNDVANRLIYRHDATTATSHTAGANEFGGVHNRHSECGDCHNAHNASGTDSTLTDTGATASGRIEGASGVQVGNGAAGTEPTYQLRNGTTSQLTREYQLCFKCHSGFTTLDSNAGFTPSKFRLDKGVEFNPANPSYHPIEAPGKNQTAKMTDSLAGASAFRQFNVTIGSTIRCSNCHTSSTKYNLVTPPSATADLPLHTSSNAGMLLQPYRNRLLKPASQAYSPAEFTLCYMCHSTTPFGTLNSTAGTNFSKHGRHVSNLATSGGTAGTNIDTAGAGNGNALCAECHFRQHSTTYKNETPAQTSDGSKLVSFAPNVLANGGVVKWTSTGLGAGSCTLTCHGKNHTNLGY